MAPSESPDIPLAEALGASEVRQYESHDAAVSAEMSRRTPPPPAVAEPDADAAALDEVTAERDRLSEALAEFAKYRYLWSQWNHLTVADLDAALASTPLPTPTPDESNARLLEELTRDVEPGNFTA